MSDMVEQAIAALNEKLPEGGIGACIALEVKDVGVILIDHETARLGDEDSASDCRLIASQKTFEGLLSGKVNPMTAVMLSKLKVKGDPTVAMKLSRVLG